MTKLLEKVIAHVREMPEGAQDMAAMVLMRYLDAAHKPNYRPSSLRKFAAAALSVIRPPSHSISLTLVCAASAYEDCHPAKGR
jgi:hypothetical protein